MIKFLLLAIVPFMTEHRNVTPKTEVSTNFYGSVTGIVDNAYIQAHGGGGGGGVDTNAVLDIVRDEIIPATNILNQTLSYALDDKRDKSNLSVYKVTRTENTDWTWTGENAEIVEALNNAHSKPYHADVGGREAWADIDPFPFDLSEYSTSGIEDADLSATSLWYKLRDMASFEEITVYASRPRYMDETLGPAKADQQLAAVATDDASKPADGSLMKYDASNDRFVKATAGTDYVKDISGKMDKVNSASHGFLVADENGNAKPSSLVDEITIGEIQLSLQNKADRATTLSGYGITDGATKTELAAAVSTNNPAFVSAVQNTPTENMPEDVPTDWGTYGTVGAALAALAAFVKWAKAKIVAVIGDDGKPTDKFTTDLLGKQVANIKANSSAFAPEYDATSAYSVGTIVYHDGNIYQCKTEIPEGGEAWNAEHWELKKLNDFFTESNSLLTDLIAIKTSGKADQSNLDALAAKVDTANAALEEVA